MGYDAPDYQHVLWDNGRPYWLTASGKKLFIPPLTAAQMRDNPEALNWAKQQGVSIDYQTDPETGQVTVGEGGVQNHAAPGGSLFRERGQWNSETGEWDRPINWSNIMAMGVGGAMAAPFVVPAVAGAFGGGAPAASGAAGGLVGTGEAAVASAPLAGTIGAAVPSSIAGGAIPGGAALGGGTASTLGTAAKIANAARNVGGAVTQASSQSRDNRVEEARMGQSAQAVYERALMERAKLEDDQRKNAVRDIYRSSYAKNYQDGPYSAKPQAAFSPEYLGSLSDLERQGVARLAADPEYNSTKLKPLVEKEVAEPGKLEKTGQWLGPTLQTLSTVADFF